METVTKRFDARLNDHFIFFDFRALALNHDRQGTRFWATVHKEVEVTSQ